MDDTRPSERLIRVKAAMGDWGWPGFEPWVESARAKDPEAARDLLAALVIELRELEFPSSPISIPLARFVADALAAYLDGNEQTLDKAFGVARGRGAPVTATAAHFAIAQRILRMLINGQSWREVANAASTEAWSVTDERELRRIYNRFQTQAMSEELARRLNEGRGDDESRA